MNDLPYTLLRRNEVVALYGIGGAYTDEILHWEVSKIYIRKDKYGAREALPSNEKFGRDLCRCVMKYCFMQTHECRLKLYAAGSQ